MLGNVYAGCEGPRLTLLNKVFTPLGFDFLPSALLLRGSRPLALAIRFGYYTRTAMRPELARQRPVIHTLVVGAFEKGRGSARPFLVSWPHGPSVRVAHRGGWAGVAPDGGKPFV